MVSCFLLFLDSHFQQPHFQSFSSRISSSLPLQPSSFSSSSSSSSQPSLHSAAVSSKISSSPPLSSIALAPVTHHRIQQLLVALLHKFWTWFSHRELAFLNFLSGLLLWTFIESSYYGLVCISVMYILLFIVCIDLTFTYTSHPHTSFFAFTL